MAQTPRAVIYQVATHVNIPQGGIQMVALPPLAGGMSLRRRLAIVAINLELAVDVIAILALTFLSNPTVQQSTAFWALTFTGLGDLIVLGLLLFVTPTATSSGGLGLPPATLKKALHAATIALLVTALAFVMVTIPLGLEPFIVRVAVIALFVVILVLDAIAARLVHIHT